MTIKHLCTNWSLYGVIIVSALWFSLAQADSDYRKAVERCGEEYRACTNRCDREETKYVNKQQECVDRRKAENKRHSKALQYCRDEWGKYRKAITDKYNSQSQACSDAKCREQVLKGYNLLWNSSALGQEMCENTENGIHEDNMDDIDKDCAAYEQSSREVGKSCRDECRNEVKNCVKEAKEQSGSSGNGAGMRTEPCPPGTQPNPLGLCVAEIRTEKYEDTTPEGCPPGTVRGPQDDCVPRVQVVGVFRAGDEWYLYCPPGTKPSPNDGGCIFDPGIAAAGGTIEGGRQCPPGTQPGPDDACVPVPPPMPRDFGSVPLDDMRIMRIEDPRQAIMVTKERLKNGGL